MSDSRALLWVLGTVVVLVVGGILVWRSRIAPSETRAEAFRPARRPAPAHKPRTPQSGGENWQFYFARVNDSIASLFVDLGRRAAAPDATLPVVLWAHVKMRKPRPDGLSSSEEAPELIRLEDALAASVRKAAGAQLVGRITSAGYREYYFYGPRAKGFEPAVAATLRDFAGYEAETGSKDDAAWSQYLEVLYPTPADLQRIQNQGVYEALRKEGDDPSIRRVVAHWAYFPSAKSREAFVTRAVAAGYREVVAARSERDGQFGVELEMESTTADAEMDPATVELAAWAAELGGDYDGWETSVEKQGGATGREPR